MQMPELIPGNCAMYVFSHFIKRQDSEITINGLELDSEIAIRNDGQDLFRKELELNKKVSTSRNICTYQKRKEKLLHLLCASWQQLIQEPQLERDAVEKYPKDKNK